MPYMATIKTLRDRPQHSDVEVFRDFRRSKIMSLRDAVARRPFVYSLGFVAVVGFWTVAMTAGAGLHSHNVLAVNLSPHVSLYTIILGFFIYPRRLIWVPALTFLAVYLYPFVQPSNSGTRWIDIDGLNLSVAAVLFLINLGSGLAQGLVFHQIFDGMNAHLRPHKTDLLMSIAAFFLFGVACLLQNWGTWVWAQGLDDPLRSALGFTPEYFELATMRVVRGCVVISAFFLATIEVPAPRDVPGVALVVLAFLGLALVQRLGFELYGPLDTVVLAGMIALTVPVQMSIMGCIIGVASISSVTGHFLGDTLPADPSLLMLERYSMVALILLVLLLAVKSVNRHVIEEKDSAIRRLDQARDLAGVGLFALNGTAEIYRLDEAGGRMLGLGASAGPIDHFAACFDADDVEPVLNALTSPSAPIGPYSLRILRPSGGRGQVAEVFLWRERTSGGEHIAYGLLIDVTAAEDRERRLRDTLAELSTRQERQRQMFSIISHELRTPASILSMLIEDLVDSPDPARTRHQMRDTADHLMTVLDDMRQTVNPEKNLPVKRTAYAPKELAESVRNTMELTARDKGLMITLVLGSGAQRVRMGDVVRMKQALINIVRNAVLHSQGRQIFIRYCDGPAPEGSNTPISLWQIEDDGVGIPENDIERLFQPFERGAKDPRQLADGSGLGLFIARESLAILGGSVEHYVPPRGGTGFALRLLEDAPLPEPAGPVAKPRAAALSLDIVLAEDHALVAEITKARLEKSFGRVRLACNGREALAMIAQHQPDLVITDLFMPELDGDDLIRRLREGGYTRPIVGLTAAVVGHEMERFHAAGANVVMKKPLDFEVLRNFIDTGFPRQAH